jgi:threonine/homoserine/homoserine lactone efflux protein
MVHLAYHIIRSKPVEDDLEKNGLNSFKAGFTMQFLNIKVILYGITVFSLFIIGTYHDPMSIGLFSMVLAGIGFVSTSCWAFGGNLFRNLLRKNYRIFNLVMAGLLVYTAIASLLSA